MGFQEKGAWACLLGILAVYVPYFYVVFQHPMSALGLFWVAAIGLVGLLVLFHVVNALATKSIRTSGNTPPFDELDRKIEVSSAKWAGLVLGFAVASWILVAMYALPFAGAANVSDDQSSPKLSIPVVQAMWAIHWLNAGFVVANLAYYAGIVVGYRRLARG